MKEWCSNWNPADRTEEVFDAARREMSRSCQLGKTQRGETTERAIGTGERAYRCRVGPFVPSSCSVRAIKR